MNIERVHKFGCPICASKELFFQCTVLSSCLKENFQVAVGSKLIPEVLMACGSVQWTGSGLSSSTEDESV